MAKNKEKTKNESKTKPVTGVLPQPQLPAPTAKQGAAPAAETKVSENTPPPSDPQPPVTSDSALGTNLPPMPGEGQDSSQPSQAAVPSQPVTPATPTPPTAVAEAPVATAIDPVAAEPVTTPSIDGGTGLSMADLPEMPGGGLHATAVAAPSNGAGAETTTLTAMFGNIGKVETPAPASSLEATPQAKASPAEPPVAVPQTTPEPPTLSTQAYAAQVVAEAQPAQEVAHPHIHVAEDGSIYDWNGTEWSLRVAAAAAPAAVVAPAMTVGEPAKATATLGLPESTNVLSELLGDIGGEGIVDVNAAIDSVPGLIGGPSEGGFSWHTLEPCMQCWRKAYYTHIRGLVPKKPAKALQFGSAYHACWELRYVFGGQRPYDEVCDAIRKAGAPKLAAEVQQLFFVELQKYAQQEADEWDIRAVEANAVFWADPIRINGKNVYLPFSCRHDTLIAKRRPGDPCAPPGPVESGIYIVDRKTTGQMTYDMVKGYAMDGQFLMNAICYLRSDEAEKFGPLRGMIFSVAAKHAKPDPDRSFHRVETVTDEPTLERFLHDELIPVAAEFYRRLDSPECRGDINLWAKNHSQCVGRYGLCPFFHLCDNGGQTVLDAMYRVEPHRIFTLERLFEPPAAVKRAARLSDPKKADADAVRKTKAAVRAALSAIVLKTFAASIRTTELFKQEKYLVPNHTRQTVLAQLVLALRDAWPVETEFPPFGPLAEANGISVSITVTEKSFNWMYTEPAPPVEEPPPGSKKKKRKPKATVHRGKMTHRAIAEQICEAWWDLGTNPPQAE